MSDRGDRDKIVQRLLVYSNEERRTMAPLEVGYTNHRGEWSIRRIHPIGLRFSTSRWHKGEQWLLDARDEDKGADREFAMDHFGPEKGKAEP